MKTNVVMFLLVSSFALGVELQDFSVTSPYVATWNRVPVILGQAQESAIDSSRPLISCERVRKESTVAAALLNEIFQEQEKLLVLLERLKDASQEEISRLLKAALDVEADIEAKQVRLETVFPPQFQEKDRTRTITWQVRSQDLVGANGLSDARKFEWAQLEVLSGHGGWFGRFFSSPGARRPMCARFDAFIRAFDGQPERKREVTEAFSVLLRSINEHFTIGTPGRRGIVDWQGPQGIQLVQELSPMEACVGHLSLASALLVDYEIEPQEAYPNPVLSPDPSIRYLGMGPVVLSFFVR